MENKIDVKEIVKVGVILFLITALSAALLAFVNGVTAPLIEKNSLQKEQDALRNVMSAAADFEEVGADSFAGVDNADKISKAFIAKGADGGVTGVCVITETSGYDVGIETVTGVDTDLKVTGVDIISMNETPGLGAKASEEDFRNQYIGKSGTIGVSKSGETDTEINAISGATKTSNGVTEGVNTALAAAEKLIEGGNE